MKRKLLPFLICMIFLAGCGEAVPGTTEGSTSGTPVSPPAEDITYNTPAAQDMFSDRDYEITYSNYTPITLSGSCVTIDREGTYLLTGTLSDGSVIVDADSKSKIQLILNGVTIHSQTSAPIYIKQADKVFITLAEGSTNTLSNGGSFVAIDENNIDSVIFSKDDMTINGNGSLSISSPAGHGIVSKDDLRITGGSYVITATGHGMTANDSVRIAAGSFAMETGKDGIQADNDEDSALGFVYIAGGNFQLRTTGDGISASATMQLDGGIYDIVCGGGSEYGEEHTDDMFGGGMGGRPGGGRPGGFGNSFEPTTTETDTVSAKGLKSAGPMTVTGGHFTLNTADDAVHSNNSLTVTGGTFQIATGDDGFHADETLTVQDGSIDISESYEGLEGLAISISGGTIHLYASDDGLNAAGGNDQSGFGGMGGRPGGFGGFGGDMFGASSDSYINISDGNLYVNANGDGIDSNGDLTVSGGYVVVEGPTNSGNGPLDYNDTGTISGGTVMVSGSSGMAQSLQSTGTQGVIAVNIGNCPAGTQITITDENGNTVMSVQPQKQFSCIVLSNSDIIKGSNYTVHVGSESATFEAA